MVPAATPRILPQVPAFGRAPGVANAVLAFGRGCCGMMMGARTGELVIVLLADRDPGINMKPYDPKRF